MITLTDIKNAIDEITNGNVNSQVALSLMVYKNREEWNGSIQSAIECLELAEYEVKPLKGLLVEVFKNPLGDSSNNGVTSKTSKVLIVGEGIPEVFEEDENTPVLELENRKGLLRAKPYGCKKWCMMGGNFIYSSDSRFREINAYPIPVHDRIESK